MSERRSRNTKTINYAALDNGLSDDEDFVEFTPPVKKKKVSGKENKTFKNVQNEKNSSDKANVKKKSPKQRPSLDDRKFQREIDMALKLSASEGNDSQDGLDIEDKFSGFEVNGSNDKEKKCFSGSDITADGFPDSGDDLKSSGQCSHKQEPAASTSSELPVNRQTKKVNFSEEDDSEDWTGDQSSESSPESETDDDFCPSPINNIPKKKISKKISSKSKKPNLKDTFIQSEKLTPAKKIVTIASADKSNNPCLTTIPLKSETNIYKGPNEAVESKKLVSSAKLASPQQIPFPISKPSTKSPIISKMPFPSSSSIESGNSKNSFSLVKTPFKSPSIGGNVSNVIQKTSTSKTGLRLGLSCSRNVKPLHPNVCIR